jgi:hypothetical protein
MVTHYIPRLVQANVSLKRLQDFLESTELLDEYAAQEAGTSVVDASRAHAEDIGISAASFMWSADLSSASSTPATPGGPTALSSKGRFRLRVEDELVFKKGAINLIVGKPRAIPVCCTCTNNFSRSNRLRQDFDLDGVAGRDALSP